MMSFCPYCNGFESVKQVCPMCLEDMKDLGKISDFYAPYSPYREIDDLKMTNGYQDLAEQLCVHFLECPSCTYGQVTAFEEAQQ